MEITLDNDASLGDPAAKIGIVEFSDFQCPFCLRSHTQTFPRLKESYITNRKLRYVYRDFPLDFHKEAKTAAVAANCAGKQGVYWEMHDALFMNQKRLGAPLYEKLAERLKLDVIAFKTCLNNGVEEKEVESDMSYAQSIGVRGTPTFFIGMIQGPNLVDAKKLSGAEPFAVFASVIDPLVSKGSSRQGCGSCGVKVPMPSITRFRRRAYPLHGEVTNRDRRGR
ncbi:MAG: DsbA family protein, partial [Gammaproteobacteria bacterium]